MFKRGLAGTRLGSAVIGLRDRYSLVRGAAANSTALGDMRNNALAGWLVTRLCRPDRLFIDVGAHIGSVVGEALRHQPGGVIAFEAIPSKADYLRRRYPQIVVHNVALLDHDGETSFFIDNAQSGYSSLAKHAGNMTEIVVPLRRMDSLLDADNIDVIKIDVEGAELGVLRGAERTVAANRPVIMFESGPQEDMGYTKEAMWRWFADRDYHLYFPDRITRAARPASLDVFIDSHEYPRRTMNYFGIPAEKMHDVSMRSRQLLKDPADWRDDPAPSVLQL